MRSSMSTTMVALACTISALSMLRYALNSVKAAAGHIRCLPCLPGL